MTFGEKLQKLRAREGISQDRLAELLDVSRQAVSRWERDETMPETEKVVRISDYFNVTIDYLLKDGPEQFTQTPARKLPDLEGWYREKGYQLGWLAAAVGLVYVARMTWSVLMIGGMGGWEITLWYLVRYVFLWLALVVCGLLTVTLGRRLAGQLRWYHLGWGGIMAGVSGFLWLVLLHGAIGAENESTLQTYMPYILFFAVFLAVGLVMLFVGKRKKI